MLPGVLSSRPPNMPCESNTTPEVHPNENSDFQQPNSYTPPELSSLQHEASQTTPLKSTSESLSQSEAFTSTDELRSAGSSKNNAYFCGSISSVPPVVISDGNCVTTTATSSNPYWIAELQLRMSDKEILEKGHWVNDRIIFTVFKVLRKDSRTRNLAGLQDVIPATKHGFANQEKLERFVQVINVRGNHWITLSNVRSRDGVHIYDSYVSLSRKKNVISYPINVEECACQFTDPVGFVNMYVANVQQQRGGSACGLYAITYTIALCFGRDPMLLKIKQESLGPVLKECLAKQDLTSFLSLVSKPKDSPINQVLYEWVCWVHCHCKMPDNGELMVHCTKCKRWYHRGCEQGDFKNSAWMCINCYRRNEWRKAELERKANVFNDLHKASLKHPERESLLRLYDLINEIAINGELPPGDSSCGFIPFEVYKTITGDKQSQQLGTTWSRDSNFFIVIFKEKHEDEIHIFKTLVHEMVHAVKCQRKLKGTAHNKEYKKLGKAILEKLQANMSAISAAYCNVALNQEILSAKDSS
jgi:hypothetical protein